MLSKKAKKITIATTSVLMVLLMVSASGEFKAGKAIEIFYNVLRTINMEYVDEVDNDKLLRKATDEMLKTLDPYTVYLDEKEMEDLRVSTSGKYGGVGSLVKPSKEGKGYPTISGVYEGFPMQKAGVTPGDTIIAVGGHDVKGMELSKVTELMKGTPGTVVDMKIKKLRGNKVVTYPVKREVVRINPVDYYGFVEEGIGYISFNNFSTDGAKEVKKALVEMKNSGKLKGLILDLRGNGGGLVSEAVEIVSLFVPRGSVVVSMRGRDESENKVYRTTSNPVDTNLPVAVLINRRSASASEIVAGALQDLDRGYIIGERSFGKGLVQAVRPVGYGSFVKTTISKYYTPSGRCIQALDYTHRNEDGGVDYIPDSLITAFKSKGGRTLYDGGGIMPDSVITPDYLSLFVASVATRGYIDDFATDYYRRNTKAASVDKFKITDKDYSDFGKMLKGKDIEFESKSEEMLEELRDEAKKERNLDMIKGELDAIEKKLKHRDREKSLAENKATLSELIEMEILSKYYYNTGRTERLAKTDNDIDIAANILKNSTHYNYVLKNKSPRKN